MKRKKFESALKLLDKASALVEGMENSGKK